MKIVQHARGWKRMKLVAATAGLAAAGALAMTVGMGDSAATPAVPIQAGKMTLGETSTITTPPKAPETPVAEPAVKATQK